MEGLCSTSCSGANQDCGQGFFWYLFLLDIHLGLAGRASQLLLSLLSCRGDQEDQVAPALRRAVCPPKWELVSVSVRGCASQTSARELETNGEQRKETCRTPTLILQRVQCIFFGYASKRLQLLELRDTVLSNFSELG